MSAVASSSSSSTRWMSTGPGADTASWPSWPSDHSRPAAAAERQFQFWDGRAQPPVVANSVASRFPVNRPAIPHESSDASL